MATDTLTSPIIAGGKDVVTAGRNLVDPFAIGAPMRRALEPAEKITLKKSF